MILLDGVEYSIEDPATNAATMITEINQYASDNNITNSKGELIQFEVNWANPFYMILYGVGVLFNYIQNLVYSAGCALSIASSSERQLLNIADCANIHRKAATKTTIYATVYANLVTTTGAVDCEITTSLTVTVNTSAGAVVFYPAFDITVPIDSSRNIVLVTDTEGSFSIPAGTITSFDNNPEGFRKIVSLASVPGQEQESIAALRQRMQNRSQTSTRQDLAQDAIAELPGVSVCNVYFNSSVSNDADIGGVTVPPRQALITVQGYSDKIAQTFYAYMSCECAGSDAAGAVTQTYTSKSGQVFTVYILPPRQIPVYVHLFANTQITDAIRQNIKDTIASLSSSITIGQRLTSVDIINACSEAYPDIAFSGCTLSLDNTNYSYQVEPAANQLLVFTNDNLSVEGTEER